MNLLSTLLLLGVTASASQDLLDRAKELYQRTDYKASLQVLAVRPSPSAATHCLIGKNHFMLGEWKQATDSFEQALALAPTNAEYALWLGRAYGRRAETANWMMAGFHAAKTRQYLEKAVALSPHYNEALNDLFAYYLEAPGFLGGGVDKAEAIARRIAERSPAEYHFAEAQLAEKRKDYPAAEQHLHHAIEQAPHEVGRVIDLATYLARRGRMEESDTAFAQAEKLAPNDPRIAFAHARIDVEHKRNLDEARRLLKKYLESNITPDDPPKTGGGKAAPAGARLVRTYSLLAAFVVLRAFGNLALAFGTKHFSEVASPESAIVSARDAEPVRRHRRGHADSGDACSHGRPGASRPELRSPANRHRLRIRRAARPLHSARRSLAATLAGHRTHFHRSGGSRLNAAKHDARTTTK